MSLLSFLNTIVEDDAGGAEGSTSTGNVASNMSVNLGMFGKVTKRTMKGIVPKRIRWSKSKVVEDFNIGQVEAKLNAASKKFDVERTSVAFGIEDSDGRIIKVYVGREHASEFESAISQALSDDPDIDFAELLFDMKDRFAINNVVWPNVAGEENEEKSVADTDPMNDPLQADAESDADASGIDDEFKDLDLDDLSADDMTPPAESTPTSPDANSILSQVLDMLKSEAEARRAEAEARAKEAEMKSAEQATALANLKVRNEQEVLDMEAYFQKQKAAQAEANKLAKLARYRHETSNITRVGN